MKKRVGRGNEPVDLRVPAYLATSVNHLQERWKWLCSLNWGDLSIAMDNADLGRTFVRADRIADFLANLVNYYRIPIFVVT